MIDKLEIMDTLDEIKNGLIDYAKNDYTDFPRAIIWFNIPCLKSLTHNYSDILEIVCDIEGSIHDLLHFIDKKDKLMTIDGIINYDIPYIETLLHGAHNVL